MLASILLARIKKVAIICFRPWVIWGLLGSYRCFSKFSSVWVAAGRTPSSGLEPSRSLADEFAILRMRWEYFRSLNWEKAGRRRKRLYYSSSWGITWGDSIAMMDINTCTRKQRSSRCFIKFPFCDILPVESISKTRSYIHWASFPAGKFTQLGFECWIM